MASRYSDSVASGWDAWAAIETSPTSSAGRVGWAIAEAQGCPWQVHGRGRGVRRAPCGHRRTGPPRVMENVARQVTHLMQAEFLALVEVGTATGGVARESRLDNTRVIESQPG